MTERPMSLRERPADRKIRRLAQAEREALLDAVARALEAEDDIAFAYAFGSFTEELPFHDLDIAVRFTRPADAEARAGALAARLAPLAPFPLDVVALNGRPPGFRFHVYRGRPLLVRDEEALAVELEETMRIYFDMEPTLRRATLEAFSG